MRKPYSIHIYLYRLKNNKIEYLIFKRVPIPELALPDFWQGISGAVEGDESYIEAVFREVFEESGIKIENAFETNFINRFPIKKEWRKQYGEGPTHVEEHTFYSEIDVNPILSDEHSVYRWIQIEEAEKFLTYGNTLKALKSVDNILINTLS